MECSIKDEQKKAENEVIRKHFEKKCPNAEVKVTNQVIEIVTSRDTLSMGIKDFEIANGRKIQMVQKVDKVAEGETLFGMNIDIL